MQALQEALNIPNTEALAPPERPVVDVRMGSLAMTGEGLSHEDIQKGIEMLNEEANGRVLDIEAAREAAKRENEMFDAHRENEMFDLQTKALLENEMFDAHAQALKENEQFDDRVREAKARQEPRPQEIPESKVKPAAVAPSEAIDPRTDLRKRAEIAVKEVGYTEPLSLTSEVRVDYESGKILIVDGKDIKVLEPQSSGKPKITEYAFDESTGILTISAHGAEAIETRVGDFVPAEQDSTDKVVLPKAIADLIGFKDARPVAAR